MLCKKITLKSFKESHVLIVMECYGLSWKILPIRTQNLAVMDGIVFQSCYQCPLLFKTSIYECRVYEMTGKEII